MVEEGLSEYELKRLANIRRNEEELRRLGIDVAKQTVSATGKQAPNAATRRRRAVPHDFVERRSERNLGKEAPTYDDGPVEREARKAERLDEDGSLERSTKRPKILHSDEPLSKPVNASSIKNLKVDLKGLREKYLGNIITPLGGQVKRAAMEVSSAGGSPTFSRMSGIQECSGARA